MELFAELGLTLERETGRSHALPVPIHVLTTLGFLVAGTFQRELADRSGVSQSSLRRAMAAVWDRIICMSARYLRFPYNAVDQANIKMQFAAIAGFPKVIGEIDCKNITMTVPSDHEFAYVSKRKFNSINVQVICDAKSCLVTPFTNLQTA